MMLTAHHEAEPALTARDVLMRLYALKSARVGHKVTVEEFYPLELETEITNLMPGWKVVRIDSLGTSAYGRPVAGRCDHRQKAILVAKKAFSEGKIAYTVAHELYHALMHQNAPTCIGSGLNRIASARQSRIASSDPEANKREREAEVFAKEVLMPAKAVRAQFKNVLGCESIWFLSDAAERIRGEGQLEPKAVAVSAAAYSQSSSVLSLKRRFGVSAEAMGIRLLELRLVY